jgi:hypothetical protein
VNFRHRYEKHQPTSTPGAFSTLVDGESLFRCDIPFQYGLSIDGISILSAAKRSYRDTISLPLSWPRTFPRPDLSIFPGQSEWLESHSLVRCHLWDEGLIVRCVHVPANKVEPVIKCRHEWIIVCLLEGIVQFGCDSRVHAFRACEAKERIELVRLSELFQCRDIGPFLASLAPKHHQ